MVKCPSCNSDNADGTRFCNYCGVPLNVTVNVPDTEEPLPVLQLDDEPVVAVPVVRERIDPQTESRLMQQIQAQKQQNSASNLLFLKIAGAVCGGFFLIAILVSLINTAVGILLIVLAILGIFGAGGYLLSRITSQNSAIAQQKENLERQRGKVRINYNELEYDDEENPMHYSAAVQQLMIFGFTNVRSVSLGDLKAGSSKARKLDGNVTSIVADGDEISGFKWYDSNTPVLVKYHGVKPNV